jgi:3-methyladenine DNA glycosylase AlkD
LASADKRVASTLEWLERRGTKANRDGMARYGLVAAKVFGVSVGNVQALAKQIGRDHDLALALWDTEWYEARLLTAFVDDPARVTSSQMDRWARDFENWGDCDTVCMHLFDKTPYAWKKVELWSKRKDEFVKRAAFALLASLALHDRDAKDAIFLKGLKTIRAGANDERNFVKKGVSWALRSIGHRNSALHAAAIAEAEHLAESRDSTERWVGKDALRDLMRPIVIKKVAARDRRVK